MTNVFFPDEQVSTNDLYFVCYMIERIARRLKQPNKYVANAMGHDELAKKLSLADVLHAENPLAVEAERTVVLPFPKGNEIGARRFAVHLEHMVVLPLPLLGSEG